MFPRNAATPPEIDLGQILQLSDGAIQTTGASVRVKIGTGAWGAGAGTLSCDATSGIWTYAPTQAETNAAYFIVGVYKASCTALSKTVVTSISATAGYTGLDWANILSPTTTVNLSGTTVKTATDVETDTQDIQSRLPAALVGGRIDANMGAISADSVAADNAESFFDGTGYAGTNNVIPTVTTLTNKTGFSLSQSFPANFASLAITAGGAVTVGTNNDKTGYSLSQSFPANFASMNLDVSGRVLLQATQTGVTIPTVTTVTNRVSANTDQIAGVAVSTSTAQIGVNVVNAGGTAWGSGAITAGAIASNAITSAKIATDAIGASQLAAGCITSSELAASAITAIQSGLATTANVLAVETDTQDIQSRLPAALVGGRIDANIGAISSDSIAADNAEAFFDGTGYAGTGNTIPTVTTVGSVSGAVGSVTGNVGGNVVGSVGSVTSPVTVGTNNDKAGYSLSTVAIQAIWDALTSALSTVGSVGKLIVDNINATISSRATQTSVDAIDDFVDTEITAIKTKTDNLPSDPASASTVAASFTTVNTKLDAIDDFVDTEITAIKVTTDKLDTTVELDGAVYRFTTNALEQAPAGGGGGGTDWTTDERTAIRSILGIPGSGTTPADPSVGILDTIRDSAVDIQSRLPASLDAGNMRSSVQNIGAVADGVWDEAYADHNIAGSFGKLLNTIRKANLTIDGTVSNAITPTTLTFSSNVAATTSAYAHAVLLFVSGPLTGENSPIISYNNTNGVFVLEEALTAAPSNGDEFVVIAGSHVHAIADIQSGLATSTGVTAAFTEIKGAGWSSATDTLEKIAESSGGGGTSIMVTPVVAQTPVRVVGSNISTFIGDLSTIRIGVFSGSDPVDLTAFGDLEVCVQQKNGTDLDFVEMADLTIDGDDSNYISWEPSGPSVADVTRGKWSLRKASNKQVIAYGAWIVEDAALEDVGS